MASSNHHTTEKDRKWSPPSQFGNYIIEKEIDGGGMGTVYKGMTADEHKTVAIKFLLESSQYKRFQREIDAGKRMHHPNFVRYHDTGEVEGHFYIVMDFVDGLPLKKYMEQNNLNPDKRLELFHKIVSAIAYAHQAGIIHRDLKPANIMITRQAEPIILDFGLAKYLQVPDEDVTALTMEGQIIGTPGYMSPEQARGEVENQDERTDIFALGIILYEMLTARNPFEGANFLEVCYNIAHRAPANIEQVLPGIPPRLAYICNKALAREKEDRYQNAQEFADDLQLYNVSRQKAYEYPTMSYQESKTDDMATNVELNLEHKSPVTDRKTPSTDRKASNTDRYIPLADRKTPAPEYKNPKTDRRPPMNELPPPVNYAPGSLENQPNVELPRPSVPRIRLTPDNELIPDSKGKWPLSQRSHATNEDINVDRNRKITCALCGTLNPIAQDFCQNCHKPLNAIKAAATIPPPITSSPPEAANVGGAAIKPAPPVLLLKPKPPAFKPILKFPPAPEPTKPSLPSSPLPPLPKKPSQSSSPKYIRTMLWLLSGGMMMLVAMIPSSKEIAIWGYSWDVLAGCFAALLVTHFPRGWIGGLLFASAALLAWAGKWTSQALPADFLPQHISVIVVALFLAFLLGINFGLIAKIRKN